MRSAYSYWAFGLLMWVGLLAYGIWQHALFVPLVPLAQFGGEAIYGRLRRAQRLPLLVPGFVALAVVLAALNYMGDLALFPHSPRAAERLPDAAVAGVLGSVAGLLTAWGTFNMKRT